MFSEGGEVVKQGTWLYAGEIVCELRILRRGWNYGSGDYEDEKMSEKIKKESFITPNMVSTNSTEYKTRAGGYESLEEAMTAATLATLWHNFLADLISTFRGINAHSNDP